MSPALSRRHDASPAQRPERVSARKAPSAGPDETLAEVTVDGDTLLVSSTAADARGVVRLVHDRELVRKLDVGDDAREVALWVLTAAVRDDGDTWEADR